MVVLEQHALALRTSLVIGATDDAGLRAALATAADSVTVDLATAVAQGHRGPARKAVAKHAAKIAAAGVAMGGRAVHVRVSGARSGELEADIAAAAGQDLAAVLLAGAETPQDVRDADVAIRKHEMRLDVAPGSARLIPQIDSAQGLRTLPAILSAVDRHGAVALDADAAGADLGVSATADSVIEHAMWDVAVAASAAGLPWTIDALSAGAGERARLAARAREFGAAGASVVSEAEVLGLNALFTPPPDDVASARRLVEEWERLRRRGRERGTAGDAVIDRRSANRARALIALADAIERRERAR